MKVTVASATRTLVKIILCKTKKLKKIGETLTMVSPVFTSPQLKHNHGEIFIRVQIPVESERKFERENGKRGENENSCATF